MKGHALTYTGYLGKPGYPDFLRTGWLYKSKKLPTKRASSVVMKIYTL